MSQNPWQSVGPPAGAFPPPAVAAYARGRTARFIGCAVAAAMGAFPIALAIIQVEGTDDVALVLIVVAAVLVIAWDLALVIVNSRALGPAQLDLARGVGAGGSVLGGGTALAALVAAIIAPPAPDGRAVLPPVVLAVLVLVGAGVAALLSVLTIRGVAKGVATVDAAAMIAASDARLLAQLDDPAVARKRRIMGIVLAVAWPLNMALAGAFVPLQRVGEPLTNGDYLVLVIAGVLTLLGAGTTVWSGFIDPRASSALSQFRLVSGALFAIIVVAVGLMWPLPQLLGSVSNSLFLSLAGLCVVLSTWPWASAQVQAGAVRRAVEAGRLTYSDH